MKCKMIFMLLWGMLLSSLPMVAQQVTNKIYIPEVECGRGKTINVAVALNNDSEIVALQFNLRRPSYSTLVSNSWELTDRKSDHVLSVRRSGKDYLFVVYSPTNSPLRGNSGNIINFSMKIPENWEVGNKYPFEMTEPILSIRNGDNVLTSSDPGALLVIEDPRPDVAVSDVKVDKSSYAPGEKIQVSWMVKNEGDKETGGGWSEQVSLVSDNGEEIYLGKVYYESILGIGGTISRQAEFTISDLLGIDGTVKAKVKLVPGANLGELTAALGNNTAQSEAGCTIAKKLRVELPTVAIEENNTSLIRCKLYRSGSWVSEQTFTLRTDKPERLDVPESVTIPAGQSGGTFYIHAIDNDILNTDSIVKITIEGNGYEAITGEVGIVDNELPSLTLTSSKNELTEGENFTLTVERELVKGTPLIVYLTCDHLPRFSFPAQVVIPAGEKSVSVDVKTVDDDLPDVTISAEFTASASRHIMSKCLVILNDNDLPEISLTITPETVSESAGPLAVMAVLRRLTHTDNAITVRLSDNSNGKLLYSSNSLKLASGVTEVRFSIGVVDNALVDGDKDIDITAAVYISSCSCSATGNSAGIVHAKLTILDDDGPGLQIKSSQTTLLEGKEGTKLTVTRNTSVEQPLAAKISSDRDDELIYNHNITLPAGQISVDIPVMAKANEQTEGDRTVTFTVEAEGYSKGICWVMITDQTLPDAVVNSVRLSSSEIEAEGECTVTLSIKNEGASVLQDITPVRLYIQSQGKTELLTTFYTQTKLQPGSSEELTKTVTFPDWTGVCEMYAIVNEDQKINELMYLNNTSEKQTITLLPKFTVTVSAEKTVYKPGEAVCINGVVSGSTIADVPVELYYINSGIRQTISVMTDVSGHFTYSFQPLAYQMGHFAIGACYPGEELSTEQAFFDIYGLTWVSTDYVANEVLVNTPYDGSIQLKNPGKLSLSNLKVNIKSLPDNCEITFDPIPSIGAEESVELKYHLVATAPSENLNMGDQITAEIVTDEEATLNLTVYYRALSPKAQLKASISSIKSTMVKGSSRDYQFDVENMGDGETGKIYLSLPPNAKWLSSATPATLPSINKGEKTTIILRFTPIDDMPLNIPVEGTVGVNCENGSGLQLNFSVEPVSVTTGRLIVDVWDEYTEYTAETPHVEGATVKIKHPTTGLLVKEGMTDADGLFTVGDMPEGYYVLEVGATKHDTKIKNILVDPGKDNNVMVYLNFQAISYSWDVKETEIEDKYEITTTVEFETRVPVPVVKIDWPESIEYKNQIIPLVITNLGLITANNVTITMPESEGAHFTYLTPNPIPALAPGQAETMYVKLTTVEGYFWGNRVNSSDPVYYTGEGHNFSGISNVSNVKYYKPRDRDSELNVGKKTCAEITLKESHSHKCHGEDIFTETLKKYYVGDCSTKGSVTISNTTGGGGVGGGGGSFGGWGGGSGSGSVSGSGGGSSAPSLVNDDCDKGSGGDDDSDSCEDAAWDAVGNCSAALLSLAADLSGVGAGLKAAAAIAGTTYSFYSCYKAIDRGSYERVSCFLGGLGYAKNLFPGLGTVMSLIDCGKGLFDTYKACSKSSIRNRSLIFNSEEEAKIYYYSTYFNVYGNLLREYFPEDTWGNASLSEIDECLQYLQTTLDSEFRIVLTDNYLDYKPEALSVEAYNTFVTRWNNTMELLNNGGKDQPEIFNQKVVDEYISEMEKVDEFAVSIGYQSGKDMCLAMLNEQIARIEDDEQQESSNSVCSSITLEFKQTMTFTRQAFRGTLTVYNGHETESMKDVKINVVVKDEDGNIATEQQFAITKESIDTFGGDTQGPWTLAAQASGTATILFVPTKDAAPDEPHNYSFGGTLSYVDPFTGLEVSRTLYPQTLTVNPTPILDLTYFMQRDVLGDDPLTQDVVEPMEQAEFSLIIRNVGKGNATNLSIETMQPQVTANEKGLDITFEMVGSQLNGGDYVWAQPKSSIVTSFGDIDGGTTAYTQWWFTSTLLGHFNKYDVEATHLTSYDNPNLSLLGDVTIHELIRSIKVSADESQKPITGFLVNDIKDIEDNPDRLYFSDGSEDEVAMALSSSTVASGDNTYVLSVVPSSEGWNYGNLSDPTSGRQKLVGIVRKSDHKAIDLRNFWQTDRTLRDGKDPLYEKRLHFVDSFNEGQEQSYILTFEPCPDVTLTVESYSGIPEKPVGQPLTSVTVHFNKPVDPATFTAEDITLRYQGNYLDSSLIEISTEDNQEFTLDISKHTAGTGYYSLTVQTANIVDYEGYKGKDGKQVGWNQLTDGKLSINIIVTPVESGEVTPESGKYDYETKLNLRAVANEGYNFLNYKIDDQVYSENTDAEYTVLTSKTIYAVFRAKSYNITVNYDAEGGIVTGPGIYDYNTEIQLYASSNLGYIFKGWKVKDEVVSTDVLLPLTVKEDVEIEAVFVKLADAVTVSYSLPTGWNWLSVNVKDDNLDNPIALLDPIKESVISVLGQTEDLVYDEQYGLYGSLTSFRPDRGYKMRVKEDVDFALEGIPFAEDEVTVTLNKGWNWMGYTPNMEMSVCAALENLIAEENDIIMAQDNFATYDGANWIGSLTALTPGSAYLYYSNSVKSFNYPAGSSSKVASMLLYHASDGNEPMKWQYDKRKYADNMGVISKLYSSDGQELPAGSYMIGAFVGDECRGGSSETDGYQFITVHGESADAMVTFRAVNMLTGEEFNIKETIRFDSNVVGNLSHPVVLHLGSATGIEEIYGSLLIYPNPVKDRLFIRTDLENVKEIRVFDMKGSTVLTADTLPLEAGLDVTSLTDGVYFITIETDTDVIRQKFIKSNTVK